jgi:hypothetical protein
VLVLVIIGLLIGLALSYAGLALVTNHRGFADWFQESERRRRELARGGTVWRPEDLGSARGIGFVVLIAGIAFIASSYAAA